MTATQRHTREALAGVRAQPVTSALLILIAAISCALIQLTTGRTAGVEADLLNQIDEATSRMIVVRAQPDAGLTMGVLPALQAIHEIESVMVLGPATDIHNTDRGPTSPVIASRPIPAQLCETHVTCADANVTGTLLATAQAQRTLGVSPGTGTLVGTDGLTYGVGETIALPAHLAALEPLALTPIHTDDLATQPAAMIIVLVKNSHELAAVTATLTTLIDVPDPTKISLDTGASYAELRAGISGQVGTYGHGLLVMLLLGTGAVIGAIVLGVVLLRRREFGRRRSLGATRTWLIRYVITQVVVLVAVGAVIGTIAGLVVLAVESAPMPAPSFVLAVLTLTLSAAAVFAVLPAAYAARRDPVAELRVP